MAQVWVLGLEPPSPGGCAPMTPPPDTGFQQHFHQLYECLVFCEGAQQERDQRRPPPRTPAGTGGLLRTPEPDVDDVDSADRLRSGALASTPPRPVVLAREAPCESGGFGLLQRYPTSGTDWEQSWNNCGQTQTSDLGWGNVRTLNFFQKVPFCPPAASASAPRPLERVPPPWREPIQRPRACGNNHSPRR